MARALSERTPLAAEAAEAADARRLIRAGAHTGHTAAMAPAHVQGNLCILPTEYAADFAARIWTSARMCPATECFATARQWTSPRTS